MARAHVVVVQGTVESRTAPDPDGIRSQPFHAETVLPGDAVEAPLLRLRPDDDVLLEVVGSAQHDGSLTLLVALAVHASDDGEEEVDVVSTIVRRGGTAEFEATVHAPDGAVVVARGAVASPLGP